MQLSNEEDYNLSLKIWVYVEKTKYSFLIRKNLKKSFFIISIWVRPHWQKKRLNLDQHPKSTGLKLVQVEMLVYDDKLDIAEITQWAICYRPTNEEIFIQKG
jgi:hypothetical protein